MDEAKKKCTLITVIPIKTLGWEYNCNNNYNVFYPTYYLHTLVRTYIFSLACYHDLFGQVAGFLGATCQTTKPIHLHRKEYIQLTKNNRYEIKLEFHETANYEEPSEERA